MSFHESNNRVILKTSLDIQINLDATRNGEMHRKFVKGEFGNITSRHDISEIIDVEEIIRYEGWIANATALIGEQSITTALKEGYTVEGVVPSSPTLYYVKFIKAIGGALPVVFVNYEGYAMNHGAIQFVGGAIALPFFNFGQLDMDDLKLYSNNPIEGEREAHVEIIVAGGSFGG